MNIDQQRTWDKLSNKKIWITATDIQQAIDPKIKGNVHFFLEKITNMIAERARQQGIDLEADWWFNQNYEYVWYVVCEPKT